MPIIQLRPASETGFLLAPINPLPHPAEITRIWMLSPLGCEMLLYPPDYLADITPNRWNRVANIIISVDNSGERADLIAAGKSRSQADLETMLHNVRAGNPDHLTGVGEAAVIDETNPTGFVARSYSEDMVVIGGLVLCVESKELPSLRSIIPERTL